ncbi:thioredoxin-like protein CXXS1 [Diospyros lotus]|uniref:thioredoxin-like protein CXXS1 n=1 Tax=Diospyros lotus TaxID=55363 RepID=UPI002258301A|nr:thioredoxin-like protein CXXS1 [Diospyros lotus]
MGYQNFNGPQINSIRKRPQGRGRVDREKKEMETQQEQQNKHKVVKVDSRASWDSYLSQATNQGCPVVAHFTASWCIPSVAMNPFFEQLASTHPDVLFLTVDVDELKEVAATYEVKAMPTFLLIKEGSAVDKLVGANPEVVKRSIEGLISSSQVHVA